MKKALHRAARRFAPDREAIIAHRWLRPVAARLAHPSLWHLNRRSVVRAVPLGLLIAFMVPLGQVVAAAFAALYLRAHVPVAAGITFVTNPVTLPVFYYAAYRVGAALLPWEAAFPSGPLEMAALTGVAAPLLLGFVVMGLVSAGIGFALTSLWWRSMLAWRWRRRRGSAAQSSSSSSGSPGIGVGSSSTSRT